MHTRRRIAVAAAAIGLVTGTAVVTLTKPKNCGKGVTQFTRLAETFTHSRPSGASKRLSVSFPCSTG